jgi:hypothetical protein
MAATGSLEDYKAIKLSTYAVLFFGTTHQGATLATWGKLLADIAGFIGNPNKETLRNLERNSEWLQHQLSQYTFISSDFVTKFYYETIRPVRVFPPYRWFIQLSSLLPTDMPK